MPQEEQPDQFAALGGTYEQFSVTPFRRYLEAPSVLAAIGDVNGAAVFDLGCGAGDYTRWLRTRGASRVVGQDVSQGMLDHARQRESQDPLGIEYVLDVPSEMDAAFDLVLSVYVMPYATTREELRALCALAARVLRPGGRFVTLPVHPDLVWDQPDYYVRYGFGVSAPTRPRDGGLVNLHIAWEGNDHLIEARYWSQETLEATVRETGFQDIAWLPHQVTEAGVADHGQEFWRPYLDQPHAAILACRAD